jgi:uncharacterized protein YigA (DUF484 family)
MVIDVSTYTALKQSACRLYTELKTIRAQIHTMEQQMIQEMEKTQSPIMSVTTDNKQGIIKLHDRTRRLPLTESDLKEKLRDCLRAQFGHNVPKIEEFSVAIAHRIWSERRVKREQKIVLRVNTR